MIYTEYFMPERNLPEIWNMSQSRYSHCIQSKRHYFREKSTKKKSTVSGHISMPSLPTKRAE